MKDIFDILAIAVKTANVAPRDITDVSMYKVEDKELWECSISTPELKSMEPGFISVQVDAQGSRVVQIR